MDWSHVKKRRWRDTKGCTILKSSRKREERTGREEDREIAGEDR